MACEIVECCQFFTDNMKDLPKTAAYIRSRLCFDDYERCSRFRIYREFGKESVPVYLDPDDCDAVEKAMLCLRNKQLSL